MASYKFARVLDVDGACSEAVSCQTQALTAGCGFATTMLRLFLLPALDKVRAAVPSVCAKVVVDDLTLSRIGGQEQVEEDLAKVSRIFEAEIASMGMDIAVSKSQTVSANKGLREGLARRLQKLGAKAKQATKNLGVHFTPRGRTRDLRGGRSR